MKKILTYISLFTMASLLFSCSLGENTSTTKKDILENAASHVILPSLISFKEAASLFASETQVFITNPTESTLDTLQTQWKALQRSWQLTDAFLIGPSDTLSSTINYWPKNPTYIDALLEGDTDITMSFLETRGVKVKGLPTLEYLLFNSDQGNAYVLETFTTHTLHQQYKNYVEALSLLLKKQSTDLVSEWHSDEGNYYTTFIESSTGLNKVVNAIVSSLELVKYNKVGKPFGKSSGGETRPFMVESRESQTSLYHIKANTESLERIYNCQEGDASYTSLYTYLKENHYTFLATEINNQLQTTKQAIDEISLPLWKAVDDEKEAVETLHESLTLLLTLLKTDMANAVNETIYFNDSDGD